MKALQIILISLASFLSSTAQTPVYQWAKHMPGNATCYTRSIATDAAGNVYTTGTMQGTADFDPGPGVYNLTSAGEGDIFISKLDANGNFLWAGRIGTDVNDQGESIAVDNDGNVYVVGWFSGGEYVNSLPADEAVDFDPGPGVSNLGTFGIEAFVLKLDTDGNFVWAGSIEGEFPEYAYSVTVDANQDVIISGTFFNAIDADPGAGVFPLTGVSGLTTDSDIFVIKWSADGNFVWGRRMGGSSSESAFAVAADAGGNILLTGFFAGTVDFDPGAGVSELTSAGDTDIFVCKLDSDGNLTWVKRMGSPTTESAWGISADPSGNVLLAIPFSGVFDVDPGPAVQTFTTHGFSDALICKLNPDGDFLWARQIGSAGGDANFQVKSDAAGNVYTAGDFGGVVDFDPGPAEFIRNAVGSDMFVAKYDPSGNIIWVAQMPGIGGLIYALSVTASNEIYSTGYFTGVMDFDPGTGTANITAGVTDIFVQKLTQAGVVPLSLLDFSGKATHAGNLLQWKTAQEFKTKNFDIEWSGDGRVFKQLASQPAAGNSAGVLNYKYLHTTRTSGDNYYRLKIRDIDNRFVYSKPIRLNSMLQPALTIFPNPVAESMQINIQAVKEETVTCYIHSADGKLIATKIFKVVKGGNQLEWNMHGLPAGKYYISSGSEGFNTQAIIRQ